MGYVWGMGIDKVTKLEMGIIATAADDGGSSLRLRASGVVMTLAGRRRKTGLREVEDGEGGERFGTMRVV